MLYSCVVTLTLCGCTAIHLNVPSRREGRKAQYLRKAKWATIAIFAPEVVLYTAWQQWWTARKLCKKLSSVEKKPTGPEGQQDSHGNDKVSVSCANGVLLVADVNLVAGKGRDVYC